MSAGAHAHVPAPGTHLVPPSMAHTSFPPSMAPWYLYCTPPLYCLALPLDAGGPLVLNSTACTHWLAIRPHTPRDDEPIIPVPMQPRSRKHFPLHQGAPHRQPPTPLLHPGAALPCCPAHTHQGAFIAPLPRLTFPEAFMVAAGPAIIHCSSTSSDDLVLFHIFRSCVVVVPGCR